MTQPHSTVDAYNGDNADSERPADDAAAGTSGRRRPLGTWAGTPRLRWPIRRKLLLGLLVPMLAILLLTAAVLTHLVSSANS
ncbi:MAG: hypothetical protein ACRDPW_04855, partial [Mycobacteriales bacterium]